MALSIKDAEADRLARALAQATGESLTTAVKTALRERLEREERRTTGPGDVAARLQNHVKRWSRIPDRDKRSADEIIGYNEFGHFD